MKGFLGVAAILILFGVLIWTSIWRRKILKEEFENFKNDSEDE